jgi:hypothetical protein
VAAIADFKLFMEIFGFGRKVTHGDAGLFYGNFIGLGRIDSQNFKMAAGEIGAWLFAGIKMGMRLELFQAVMQGQWF